MKKYNNKLLKVPGIMLNGIYSGVKKSRRDLGVIYTPSGISAGVFTQNLSRGVPVVVSQKNINNDITKAILINSGVANALTGEQGMKNAQLCLDAIAKELNVNKEEVLISSTGIIGKQLDVDKIVNAIPALVANLSEDSFNFFPESITTTDSFNKVCSCQIEIDDEIVTIAGVSKGSGMIHPNMATMLGFIQTDANISKEFLQKIISDVVKDTFNMISVDGDTSTNDMVIALSSSHAKHALIDTYSSNYEKLRDSFSYVCKMLAISIAMDGEGSTKLIQCTVKNSLTESDARLLAKSVVRSNLVKASIFGKDANWGRILCSLGYSGGYFNPEKTDLSLKSPEDSIVLMKNGMGIDFDEALASKIFESQKVIIEVDINEGDAKATAWGCDSGMVM